MPGVRYCHSGVFQALGAGEGISTQKAKGRLLGAAVHRELEMIGSIVSAPARQSVMALM